MFFRKSIVSFYLRSSFEIATPGTRVPSLPTFLLITTMAPAFAWMFKRLHNVAILADLLSILTVYSWYPVSCAKATLDYVKVGSSDFDNLLKVCGSPFYVAQFITDGIFAELIICDLKCYFISI